MVIIISLCSHQATSSNTGRMSRRLAESKARDGGVLLEVVILSVFSTVRDQEEQPGLISISGTIPGKIPSSHTCS